MDYNLLGMDYARLGHACLRGEPPETSAATPLPWARDGEVVASGGSGASESGCSGGSGEAASARALRAHRGFCCVWAGGEMHGLPASPAERASSCELEADAAAQWLLNARDLPSCFEHAWHAKP